ncbi:hypothetical protein [Pyxidicoccus xibeiensis]|uniref:hypothetical protein n=1 Tax=Pyxidicoccus xibeiensis TaxID=2906759 RepID=UPI0020A7FA2A|nr:hypothetical protein [Pyxidicoccus xibeiensis]MCP3139172.1 hypothetical protein [Pyxidicoccus xibeiensis]
MKRLGTAALVLAVGCAPLDVERRTERGAVLRTYTQEKTLGERLPFADVQAQWPQLTVRFTTADICRTEQHAEYAEEVISTRSSPGAAAATSSGAVLAAVGGGLLLGRTLFSDVPDRSSIDREGRFGASSRDVATGWGTGLLILGVPALVAGIVQMARGGEARETRKADELLSLREVPCKPEPADGVVELGGGSGPPPQPRMTSNGALVLTAEEVRGMTFTGLVLDGTPVLLDDDDRDRLETFRTCATLLSIPVNPEALAQEARGHPERVRMRRELTRTCNTLPGAPTGPLLEALDAALGDAADSGPTPAPPPG